MEETCAICGCSIHRDGDYAKPTIKGRSHATKHHFVAERFYGRSGNRPGTQSDPIFSECPWGLEGKSDVYCYECHEELLHNPVFTPDDMKKFRKLVGLRGLSEINKTELREKLGGRIRLLHEIIGAGLDSLLKNQNAGQ
jgi:hypothetical protein